MQEVPLDQTVRRADVLWRRVGDRVLIRRRGDDELVVLAGTGVALWDALSEGATVDTLVAALAEAHDASPAAVGPDVQVAVASLIDQRVVEPT